VRVGGDQAAVRAHRTESIPGLFLALSQDY
jgi:hypothetical protein